ncbi:ABC transporter ATP-binding protein [Crossiella cryophila]|uniref:Iron complex transport system ATP-binding protein n=1 Tax=Crossiella cryophila TaxID=43355 RepID=A0A7W7CGT4_9PSEU|nr:ABC transporter ATP-binding protein [Crossiella cryophila]MBB4679546.1 iron complex transport system ATP-binding protein [Crossiella cryophila]
MHSVSWSVPGKSIVDNVDFTVHSGRTVGLIGPNGSGKSSLLRCVAGLRKPTAGVIRFDGNDIDGWTPRKIAQHLAFVEQAGDTDSDLRVAEVVALGRTPFRPGWRAPGGNDHAIVEAALERLDLTELRDRHWQTLSGGERQRAHIARALAQQPWAILLDEPTNHLDIRHQLELLDLLARTEQTVLVALHDLSLAARFCDRLVLLHQGELVATGAPGEVLTARLLREVFEVDAEVGQDSAGNLAVVYRGTAERVSPVGVAPAGPGGTPR